MPSWPVALQMYYKLFLLWLGLGSFNKYYEAKFELCEGSCFLWYGWDSLSFQHKYIQAYESQKDNSCPWKSIFFLLTTNWLSETVHLSSRACPGFMEAQGGRPSCGGGGKLHGTKSMVFHGCTCTLHTPSIIFLQERSNLWGVDEVGPCSGLGGGQTDNFINLLTSCSWIKLHLRG